MTSGPEQTRQRNGEPTTYNLLFVCTGNTCRSPLAEALARQAIERRGWSNVEVQSAGASAGHGAPASPGALEVATEHGIDLSSHRSQPLTPELVGWADVVVAMSSWHVERVGELGGGSRVALATEFLPDDRDMEGVPDPMGFDTAAYRDTYAVLERVIEGVLDRLEAILAP